MQGRVSLPVPVTVREISLGGMSMDSSHVFEVGSIHEFGLTLGDESSVVLQGRIVYSRLNVGQDGSVRYVTGVQFVDEEPPGPPTIGDLIDKIK
jgi:hypothetical protein